MRTSLIWTVLMLMAISVSCHSGGQRPVESTMPVTTDSLVVDVLGFKLGERYSEVRAVNTLKPYLDDVKLLSEMKADDWLNGVPYVLRIRDSILYVGIYPPEKKIIDFEGVPWHRIALYTTKDGSLYKLGLYQDFQWKGYDKMAADSVFHCITGRYTRLFGQPSWKTSHSDSLGRTKYFSFNTGKIEEKKTVFDMTSAEVGWFDGRRELEIKYSDIDGPFHFSLSFKDKTLTKR